MFDSILVVCVGNICRSPTGERLLQRLLPEHTISSAGVGALVGRPIDELAADVATEHGLATGGHEARQLTPDICRDAELILVMSPRNMEEVCRISPESRGKIMLFGKWQGYREIPDPYQREREAFERAYELLEEGAISWAQALRNDK